MSRPESDVVAWFAVALLACALLAGCVQGTPYEPEHDDALIHTCRHILGCRADSTTVQIRVPSPDHELPDSSG